MTLTTTDVDLAALPPVVDLVTAAAVLGVGRTAAYELVRTGRGPPPCSGSGNWLRPLQHPSSRYSAPRLNSPAGPIRLIWALRRCNLAPELSPP